MIMPSSSDVNLWDQLKICDVLVAKKNRSVTQIYATIIILGKK